MQADEWGSIVAGPILWRCANACRAAGLMTAAAERWPRAAAASALRAFGAGTVIIGAYYAFPIRASIPNIALRAIGAGIMIALVVAWLVRSIQRTDRPLLLAVEALVIAVSLLLAVFAATYVTLSEGDVGSFSEPLDRTGGLYLTMMTLTTVGFGDIVPRTDAARVTVMVQMAFNAAMIGVAVRLIAGTARTRVAAVREERARSAETQPEANPSGSAGTR